MVHDATVTRPDLDRLDPRVLRVYVVVRRHCHPGHVAARCHGVRFLHLQHEVWRTYLPAVCELRRRRHLRRIAFLGAAIDPGDERVDVVLAESARVLKAAVVRVGLPRRHLSAEHLLLDRARPRPHVAIRHERKRRDFARTVTVGALLEGDRGDVPGEGDLVSCGC